MSAECLKAAGYLDTKDQDKISYMFIPPKKDKKNRYVLIKTHFIRTEIDLTDCKKENLISKVKKPYIYEKEMPKSLESNETIRLLDETATFVPGKKAQLAAKNTKNKEKQMLKNRRIKLF